MFRWIAIMAAIVLAISAAYGQSSSPQEQPTLPLGQGQMMGAPRMSGMMGMDPSMMPMMQHMMGAQMMGPGMGQGMMGQDMAGPTMCHGQMGMMGNMGMAGSAKSHLEARLAFVKSELAIAPAQEAAWDQYAAALRAQTKAVPGAHKAHAGEADFPARFDARVAMLEDRLSSLKAVRGAAVGLHGQLNQDQKKSADVLLAMPLCM